MGEVYRATDTTLGRFVAVKVLPERLLSDPERVARFEREAKMLAALNHPNIATVHGFETGGGAHALVMELVDGLTLAERLAQGPELSTSGTRHGVGLPLDEALRIARQIALALEAAHEQGVVHRDLKPANIKIREDGTVKVLDFGLAKMLPGAESADRSQSPTITAQAMTKAGFILGTAAYMSPEQAGGKAVSKRTDIWAFGCVLFEMLAGRRAFDAEDVSDALALVLVKDPDFSLLPADVPRPIRVLIEHCLIKDPRRRLADMSAALLLVDELRSLTASTSAGQAPATEQIEAAVAETRRGLLRVASRRVALAWVFGFALAVLAGLAAWLAPRPAPNVVRTMVTPFEDASLSVGGFDRDVTITPDGTRIVYRGVDQLLVRALDSLDPLVLPNLNNPQGVFASPDGEWVGFFDGNGALWKVPISGGPAVKLTNTSAPFPRGAAWTDDDTIVYAHSSSEGLWAVAASGGEPTRLTSVDRSRGEGEHTSPEVLPGGRALLFTIGGAGTGEIAVLDLRTRTYKVLLRGGWGPRYVASGHLVYSSGASLLAVPFDPNRLVVTGSTITLLEQPAVTPGSGLDGAVSRTGTLVYVPGAASVADQRMLVWVDRQGREEPVPAPPRTYQMVRLAPDGTRAALDVRDQDNDIWIWTFTSRTLTRLTSAPGNDMFPVWTSDSARVIFSAAPDSEARRLLASRVADGSAPTEGLLSGEPGAVYHPYDVSPDGSTLVLGAGLDLMAFELRSGPSRIPTRSGQELRTLIQTPFVEQNAGVSPDGRWLAYQSNESGRDEVYVRPFPNLEAGRWLVSTNGGRTPLWARRGGELFYGTPDGAVMSVRVLPGTPWQHEAAVQVVRPGYFHAGEVDRTFDVSPDGERFLMIKQNANAGDVRRSIVVVQNWHEDLKRLAPAD